MARKKAERAPLAPGIDAKLREDHLQRLNGSLAAVDAYDALCALVAERPDGIDAASQRLIADYAGLEVLKRMAMDDLIERGTREQYRNGNQRGERENRNVSIFQRAIEGQRKLLAELKVTPASRKTAVQMDLLDDGFTGF